MPTELLERTAIKHFKERSLKYGVLREDVIQIGVRTSKVDLYLFVVDHEFEPPLIEIRVLNIAKFPVERGAIARTMCNVLNARTVGKFLLDADGDLSFRFDCPVGKDSGPDDFGGIMELTLWAINKHYPGIMRICWGNAPIDKALEQLADEYPIPPDDLDRLWDAGGEELRPGE